MKDKRYIQSLLLASLNPNVISIVIYISETQRVHLDFRSLLNFSDIPIFSQWFCCQLSITCQTSCCLYVCLCVLTEPDLCPSVVRHNLNCKSLKCLQRAKEFIFSLYVFSRFELHACISPDCTFGLHGPRQNLGPVEPHVSWGFEPGFTFSKAGRSCHFSAMPLL